MTPEFQGSFGPQEDSRNAHHLRARLVQQEDAHTLPVLGSGYRVAGYSGLGD